MGKKKNRDVEEQTAQAYEATAGGGFGFLLYLLVWGALWYVGGNFWVAGILAVPVSFLGALIFSPLLYVLIPVFAVFGWTIERITSTENSGKKEEPGGVGLERKAGYKPPEGFR
ncbi:MAG: hypothetical protein FWD77_11710 [Betaproteobacteria bacterium]|nr:hypothetical protein [Betaproteobacteria bacterium]